MCISAQSQNSLARPITVAWMENNEVSGDQAVVKEALARVDDVEEQVHAAVFVRSFVRSFLR